MILKNLKKLKIKKIKFIKIIKKLWKIVQTFKKEEQNVKFIQELCDTIDQFQVIIFEKKLNFILEIISKNKMKIKIL